MSDYEVILNRVLDKVRIDKDEYATVKEVVSDLINKLYHELNNYIESINDIFVGGSFSRKTILKGDFDIDVFIRFPPKFSIKELSDIVIDVSKKLFGEESIRLRYAEHPYVEAIYKDISFNVVPSYKVAPPNWLSAVDRTYYHTIYLDKHFKKEFVDETLLLKSFLKGIGCYGAEVTNKGFSGYLTELLIIKYGSFLNLLKEVAVKWRPPVVVEGGDYTKKELNILFPKAPIIFLDPVDPKRNVASAVSSITLGRFISAAKAFIAKPKTDYFYPFSEKALRNYINKLSIDEIVKLPILIIYIEHDPQIEDIFYSQLERLMRKISRQLKLSEVDVLKMGAYSNFKDKSLILFLLSLRSLKELRKFNGPLIHIKSEHDYLVKNRDKSMVWIGEGPRWFKVEPSKHDDVKELVTKLIKRRVINIPSHLVDADIYIYYVDELPMILDGDIYRWLKEFVVGVEFWRSWI